jgi:hypothetical protein
MSKAILDALGKLTNDQKKLVSIAINPMATKTSFNCHNRISVTKQLASKNF